MRDNVILKKAYAFALETVSLCFYINKVQKEFVLSKQLLRSGTGIGANVEEVIGSQSRKDFVSKMSIAYKEALETNYWLRLLFDSGIFKAKNDVILSLIDRNIELLKLLSSIIKTSKSNLKS